MDKKPHYVNNADFSQAVVEYVTKCNEMVEQGKEKPIVPNYIAQCFLKIAEGLSHKSNFVRYTYREEMVMDAVENCLKAIDNYNLETATRTGKPNAFAYFTQISWYAFLRRIQKEKKQQDIKLKFLSEIDIDLLVNEEFGNNADASNAFIEELKNKIDIMKFKDEKVSEYKKQEKKKGSRKKDSDLSTFFIVENENTSSSS